MLNLLSDSHIHLGMAVSFMGKRLYRITLLMSGVSFCAQFATSVVFSSTLNFAHQWGINFGFLIFMRYIGESIGYVSKILVGLASDLLKNRKIFLLIGYGGVAIFVKPIFVLCCLDVLSLAFRNTLYVTANATEKFFGTFRDVVRDAAIADQVENHRELQANLVFRKATSSIGSVLGGLTSFVYFFFSKNLLPLYLIAASSALVSGGLLLFVKGENPVTKNEKEEEPIEEEYANTKEAPKKKEVFFLLAGSFFILCGRVSELFLWHHCTVLGFPESWSSLLFLMFFLAASCSGFLFLFLRTINGLYAVCSVTSVIALSNLICYFKFSLGYLLFLNFLYGVNVGLTEGLLFATLLRMFPQSNWKGSLLGLMNFVLGLGCSVCGLWLKKIEIPSKILLYSVVPLSIGIVFLVLLMWIRKNKDR